MAATRSGRVTRRSAQIVNKGILKELLLLIGFNNCAIENVESQSKRENKRDSKRLRKGNSNFDEEFSSNNKGSSRRTGRRGQKLPNYNEDEAYEESGSEDSFIVKDDENEY